MQSGEILGYIEVDTNLSVSNRDSRTGGWADIGNCNVSPDRRREGVGTWLVKRAAAWLDLGGVSRVLEYTESDDVEALAFLDAVGFEVLTRTGTGFALPSAAH